LQFKKQYPENFKAYAQACKEKAVIPGEMFIYATGSLFSPKYIINFPTKRHWKGKSRMEDIESGLEALKQEVIRLSIKSIALPPLGCGLGGLEWFEVKQKIIKTFEDSPEINLIIFEPSYAPKRIESAVKEVQMTSGRAALLGLLDRYLSASLDPFVTLLEAHKLMYFMQVNGQNLRLNFVKHHYGPYAENLRHVFNAVEGHFITGYADGGDDPKKELHLHPDALKKASLLLEDDTQTQTRLNRVADLVNGLETPFGLELLATVHWVVHQDHANTLEDVISKVYAWNTRKQIFSRRQIQIAYDILDTKGWLITSSL
jgi:O-acetyl-ADP-ribose deacetylase (regulator of RNase III)